MHKTSKRQEQFFLRENARPSPLKRFFGRIADGISRAAISFLSFVFDKSTVGLMNEISRARKEELDPSIAYFKRERKYGKR